MYLNTLNKSECSGCTACSSVCHVKAITMQQDEEGFLYPVKNMDICTDCGLCEKVCAFDEPTYSDEKPQVFASYVEDKSERKKSASGALFYVLAKEILALNGVVYGAVMNDDFVVVHRGVQSIEELQTLRGSKYVQSNMLNCFHEIKTFLKESRIVYFTGTPCQVAGLKRYLRTDYSNLLTSDIVCHGIPSQLLFNKHIEYLKEKHKTDCIYNYKFRDYAAGEGGEFFNFITSNGKEKLSYSPTYELSPYLYSFMYAFTYRYSCYMCPFSKVPRQGDITLADFWGVKQFYPQIDNSNGISLVLVNNDKGNKYWDRIKGVIYYQESDVEKAAIRNKNLIQTTTMPSIRVGIYERIEREGYANIAHTLFKSPQYNKIIVKRFIKKIMGNKLTHLYHFFIGKN